MAGIRLYSGESLIGQEFLIQATNILQGFRKAYLSMLACHNLCDQPKSFPEYLYGY